jgi:hypothetical protein
MSIEAVLTMIVPCILTQVTSLARFVS